MSKPHHSVFIKNKLFHFWHNVWLLVVRIRSKHSKLYAADAGKGINGSSNWLKRETARTCKIISDEDGNEINVHHLLILGSHYWSLFTIDKMNFA